MRYRNGPTAALASKERVMGSSLPSAIPVNQRFFRSSHAQDYWLEVRRPEAEDYTKWDIEVAHTSLQV